MDNGYGNLPNDHRHSIKVSGSYDITDELTLGLVARTSSGRPTNYFSKHPVGVDSCAPGNPWDACVSKYYGHVSHYDENGNPAPRGSVGNLPWATTVDLSLSYSTDIMGHDLLLKGTVYNLLNSDKALGINEQRSLDGANGLIVNPDYGITTLRQTERYASLVARFTF